MDNVSMQTGRADGTMFMAWDGVMQLHVVSKPCVMVQSVSAYLRRLSKLLDNVSMQTGIADSTMLMSEDSAMQLRIFF